MSQPSYARTLKRAFSVLAAVFKYSFLILLANGSEKRAQLLRVALEELGATWIKLGQALALRFDLLPDAYCRELFKLLNQVRPFSYETAREIIRYELGAYPEDLFESFDQEPFSAASIGQVHRARLLNGEEVAVKIQRPGIRELIGADIRAMYFLAAIVDWFHLLGVTHTRLILDEFAAWTEQELDYTIEGRHAEMLRRNQGDEGLEVNAKIYWKYTTSRVITTEFLNGIMLLDILDAVRRGEKTEIDSLLSRGYSLKLIARHIVWNLLNQIYLYGYFHADLHPANLIVLPSNRIGYVDFGIVGQLSPALRQSHVYYAWNLFCGNVERAVDEFMRWITPSFRTDPEQARAELTRVVENYLHAVSSAPITRAGDIPASEVASLAIIRRHHMIIDPSIVMCLKALVTANAVVFELMPNFDLQGEERRFFAGLIAQWGEEVIDPQTLLENAFDLNHRVQRVMQKLIGAGEVTHIDGLDSVRWRMKRLVLMGLAMLIVIGLLVAEPTFLARVSHSELYFMVGCAGGILLVSLLLILWEISHLRSMNAPAIKM
jgi:ubiquinone biosynthesis protein